MTLKIETMFAYVAEDEEGEGVAAHYQEGVGWMPLVGADMARMESLRPIAQELANAGGKPLTLITFEKRTDVETIEPYSAGGLTAVIYDPKEG
jgi:hypothetical protein